MRLNVAESSIFLSIDEIRASLLSGGYDPAQLSYDHRWTYDELGGRGLLCSEPRRVEGSTLEGLRANLRGSAMEAGALEEHVEILARGINDWRDRAESRPWRDRLPTREDEEGPFMLPAGARIEEPDDAVQAHEFLDALGIGWFLAIPARRRDQ
jgi:hypothetical protein